MCMYVCIGIDGMQHWNTIALLIRPTRSTKSDTSVPLSVFSLLKSYSIGDLSIRGRNVCEKYWIYHTILIVFCYRYLDSACLPIFDEICRRSSNFIHSCIVRTSILIRSGGLYGILFGVIAYVLGIICYFSLNDTVALCLILSTLELLDILVMMLMMIIVEM